LNSRNYVRRGADVEEPETEPQRPAEAVVAPFGDGDEHSEDLLDLSLFVAAVSFLSGRDAPQRFGLQVILIHMAAIGLGVGLVVVLNNPFRSQIKIDPAIMRDALRP
jgi:hypothetical protein